MRPTISMPKSKSYDDDDGAAAGGNAKNAGATATGKQQQQQQQQQQQSAAGGLPGAQGGNQNAGWFGGLWNKFSLKPKNQMILPDDKNPTIVWDKERKCWTNTEGTADETESFKPPPKMSDMGMGMAAGMATGTGMGMGMGMAAAPTPGPLNTLGTIPTPNLQTHELPTSANNNSNPYDTNNQLDYDANNYAANYTSEQMYAPTPTPAPTPAPGTVPAPAASPIPTIPMGTGSVAAAPASAAATLPGGAQPKLQSNMFKIKRNRTLKNSYVDVFNPSGAPMTAAPQTVLAPMMAPVAVPQGGFFVPGAAPNPQQQQQQHQQPQ